MATKKKVSELADGVFSVASEDFTIAWEGAFYTFTAGNPVAIPAGLSQYLSTSGKVFLVTLEPEEEVVAEEPAIAPEVVYAPEEPTEEVL